MKKLFISIVLIFAIASAISAQDFENYMQQGQAFFDKEDYLSALEQFDLAYDAAESDSAENVSKEWKSQTFTKIRKYQTECELAKNNAKQALRIAINEPETKANSNKKVYQLCKTQGINNYNKKLYYDAYQNFKMTKLCPDYIYDTEIDNFISKSKSALDTVKKIALVIGNANYVEANLSKPITDAKDVAAALEAMNFEVIIGLNVKSAEFDEKVKAFFQKGQDYDIALFFFTGFGYQSDYILPIDTKTDAAGNLKTWFSLNYLMSTFPKNFRTKKIFILDMDRTSEDGKIPSVMTYRNTIACFSAAPNNKAFDGVGRNSLFTEQFLKYLNTPNISFQEIFRLTREATMKVSKDRQVPTIYDNIQSNTYLNWKLD